MIIWMRHIIYWPIISWLCIWSRSNILLQNFLSDLLECIFFLAHIKMLLMCCIISDPLVLFFILICCICSYFGSTKSNYINIFPIISSFHGNPLNILVILIPFFSHFCQKYGIASYSMICFMKIHACCWWSWKIPCIMSRLLKIVIGYWCYTSFKSSSSTTSSYESSYISLILCS